MAEGRTTGGKGQSVRPRAREVTPLPSGQGQAVGPRPRARPAGREAAPEPPRAPLWSQELVLASCGALVLGPLLLAVVGSYYLFVFFGALLAAALLVVLTAALPGPSQEEQGAFVLSPGATAGVMAGSVLVGALAGGRAWAVPAVLLPVGAGWLALHAGLADHGPVDRTAVRGPHPNLQLAYVTFVAVVLVLLLAWFSGLV